MFFGWGIWPAYFRFTFPAYKPFRLKHIDLLKAFSCMTNPKFIQFKTSDKLVLPGLLYEAKNSKTAAIYLHGNGSSSIFYHEDDYLAQTLNKKGISLLLFNNRGAHIIKKLTVKKGGVEERKQYGMAYEKIKECIQDIDGAIAFLKKQGYKKFYLIGSSTGANKICVYNYYKPENSISKYVLVSGGDDTGIYYSMFGRAKFMKLLKRSREMIKKGKGEEIIKEILPDGIFSYQGFWDIANPDGDYNVFSYTEALDKVKLSKKKLFRHFSAIKKPTLVIYGDKDEYVPWGIKRIYEVLKKYQPGFDFEVVKGADHRYSGKRQEQSKIIVNWLSKK